MSEQAMTTGEKPVEITVGMKVTLGIGGDREPYEVEEVRDAKTLVIREMGFQHLRGSAHDGSAEYTYFSKPNGRIAWLRRVVRKGKERWCRARPNDSGRGWTVDDCYGVGFGYARFYRDPHF